MRSLKSASAFFLAVPVLIAVACGGSTKTHGQLMVVIDTDLSVPTDIDTIGLVVSANGGVLYNQESTAGAGNLLLPATIGVIEGSSAGEPVTIHVLGRRSSKLVVLSEVVTTVPDGRVALLRMPLQWLCEGQAVDGQSQDLSTNDGAATSTCAGSEQTCVAGSCTSEVVDSTKLPDYDPTQVYGGASAPGASGACFDTLGCFSTGYVASVDTGDCTVPAPSGGVGVNVSLVLPPGGDGICGGQACLVPLDQAAVDGWTDLGNGRLQLPTAICAAPAKGKIEGVAVTTSCATKTPSTPTCGAWNSSSANVGTTDAGAPDGALPGELGGSDAGTDGSDIAPNDAGPSFDSGPSQDAGQTCPTFTIDQSACDVIANTGCTKTQECSVNAATGASECVVIGNVTVGGACTSGGSAGTSCAPGLYCSSGFCTPFCCNNEDCAAAADAGFFGCEGSSAGDGGTAFGLCH